MENFNIQPTPMTPEVLFTKKSNQLRITGRSISLSSEQFWNEIRTRLNKVLNETKQLNILLNFEYINTRNLKDLNDLLRTMGKDQTLRNKLKVQWVYDDEDITSKDLGEMLGHTSGIPFDLIQMN